MCNQSCHHGITFTVVADGKLLSYLHVMDLCTILGNALDNAIEYEKYQDSHFFMNTYENEMLDYILKKIK